MPSGHLDSTKYFRPLRSTRRLRTLPLLLERNRTFHFSQVTAALSSRLAGRSLSPWAMPVGRWGKRTTGKAERMAMVTWEKRKYSVLLQQQRKAAQPLPMGKTNGRQGGGNGSGNLGKRKPSVSFQQQRQGSQPSGRTQRAKDLVESRHPEGTCLFWWKNQLCARGETCRLQHDQTRQQGRRKRRSKWRKRKLWVRWGGWNIFRCTSDASSYCTYCVPQSK